MENQTNSKSRQLRPHHQHGLNPTMPVCFWCGQEKGDIILLGAAYKGQAPKNMLFDLEPCETCVKKWQQGIVLIEAYPEPSAKTSKWDLKAANGQVAYPTGRWLVVTREFVQRVFQPQELVDSVLKESKAFIEPAMFDVLVPPTGTETGG